MWRFGLMSKIADRCSTNATKWEPSEEQKKLWREWLEVRPERVRMVAQRFDPWTVYRLVSTGQRAQFLGCDVGALNCDQSACSGVCRLPSGHPGDHDPEGRVTARVYVEHPGLGEISGRQVSGIDPDDLTPWTDADEEQATSAYPWVAPRTRREER